MRGILKENSEDMTMKRMFFSMMLTTICGGLFADAPPPAPPASSNTEFTMPVPTTVKAQVTAPREIRLQLEIDDNDIRDYGLQQPLITSEIQTRLSLAQIKIKDDAHLPQLVLRVKSIKADRAIASFIQLAFFEEAQLLRNQNTLQALTWSQATLISCAQEDVSKEVNQVIIQMVNSFILDYQKAISP
jgi:hypothetical protein